MKLAKESNVPIRCNVKSTLVRPFEHFVSAKPSGLRVSHVEALLLAV